MLILLVAGYRTKEVASLLKRSPSTIQVHRNNIFRKLGVDGLMKAVGIAVRSGTISLNDLPDPPVRLFLPLEAEKSKQKILETIRQFLGSNSM